MLAATLNQIPERTHKKELEAKLFAELKSAEAAFQSAAAEEKETARERYCNILDRFHSVVLGQKPSEFDPQA